MSYGPLEFKLSAAGSCFRRLASSRASGASRAATSDGGLTRRVGRPGGSGLSPTCPRVSRRRHVRASLSQARGAAVPLHGRPALRELFARFRSSRPPEGRVERARLRPSSSAPTLHLTTPTCGRAERFASTDDGGPLLEVGARPSSASRVKVERGAARPCHSAIDKRAVGRGARFRHPWHRPDRTSVSSRRRGSLRLSDGSFYDFIQTDAAHPGNRRRSSHRGRRDRINSQISRRRRHIGIASHPLDWR